MRVFGLAVAVLFLCACAPLPESYPVPPQRPASDGPEPEPLGGTVSFGDPRSPDHVVKGVLPGASDQLWRWATESPTVRLRASETANLRLRVNFALPEESHSPLLPITVRYFVNDRLLDTVRYTKAGVLEFRKAVPAEWLKAEGENLVRFEVSPVYVAKADGMKLSMILSEIALERNQ